MRNMEINKFTGRYRFLSNFVRANVEYDGMKYRTVEHAYQAAKTLDEDKRKEIRSTMSPVIAKRIGQFVPLRDGWEDMKLDIMLDLLRQKFRDHILESMLMSTGNALLIEGNRWGDTYWGQCPVGEGENHLGKLLMQVREELRGK